MIGPAFFAGLAVTAVAMVVILVRRSPPPRVGWIGWVVIPPLIVLDAIVMWVQRG